MTAGLGWQASKHKRRGRNSTDNTESVQPECEVIKQTQCTRDDETDQHVYNIARHGALLTLFPSHVATDDVKDQHAQKTSCEHVTSQTLLLVKT